MGFGADDKLKEMRMKRRNSLRKSESLEKMQRWAADRKKHGS